MEQLVLWVGDADLAIGGIILMSIGGGFAIELVWKVYKKIIGFSKIVKAVNKAR